MTDSPVPWVGLAALVAIITEPWWARALEYRPKARRQREQMEWIARAVEDQRGPVRGEITRPDRELDRRQP